MAQLISSGLGDLLPMVRTPGRHVSHAIRKLCIQLGHLEDTPFPEDRSTMELGSSFEDLLIGAMCDRMAANEPDRLVRIGEIELDGVFGTPDLIDLVEASVWEIKLTRLSCKWDPDDKRFWKYWKQLMSYVHMLGFTKGYLAICHINGMWGDEMCPHCGKPAPGNNAHFHVWAPDGGEFLPGELESNWKMIKAYA